MSAEDLQRLDRRLSEVETRQMRNSDRIGKLETGQAVGGERHATVVKRLDDIDKHISKGVWAIIGLVISVTGAALALIFTTGLKNVGS